MTNTNEARAKAIAEQANTCCNRSDGYEHNIYEFALRMLQQAYIAGRDSVRNSPNYHQPEDMGR